MPCSHHFFYNEDIHSNFATLLHQEHAKEEPSTPFHYEYPSPPFFHEDPFSPSFFANDNSSLPFLTIEEPPLTFFIHEDPPDLFTTTYVDTCIRYWKTSSDQFKLVLYWSQKKKEISETEDWVCPKMEEGETAAQSFLVYFSVQSGLVWVH